MKAIVITKDGKRHPLHRIICDDEGYPTDLIGNISTVIYLEDFTLLEQTRESTTPIPVVTMKGGEFFSCGHRIVFES